MKRHTYDIFISYRREGGYDTAKHLYDRLSSDGYSVSFDIDTLRNGDFDTALLERIDECTDFLLIVDAHAFDRTLDPHFNPQNDWLRQELAYALKKGKNIIPILLKGVVKFPDNLPEDIVGIIRKNRPEYNQYYFDAFYERIKTHFLLTSSIEPHNNSKCDDDTIENIEDKGNLVDTKLAYDEENVLGTKDSEFIGNIETSENAECIEDNVSILDTEDIESPKDSGNKDDTANIEASVDNTDDVNANETVTKQENKSTKSNYKDFLLPNIKRIIKSKVTICISAISLIICITIALRFYRSPYEKSCFALMDAIIQEVDTLKYEPLYSELVVKADYHFLDDYEYELWRQVRYYNNYNGFISVHEIKNEATNGDAFAQFCLYNIYIEGDGLAKDTIEAEKWLNKSADQLYPLALYKLILSSEDREREMERYLKKLAEKGSVRHQSAYGSMFYDKYGECSVAKHWLTKAANNGDGDAMNNLGCMLYEDNSTENDIDAVNWFERAATNGKVEAEYNLGNISLTKGHYAEAISWYEKATEQGYSSAFEKLAYMYDKGLGVKASTEQAIKILKGQGEALYIGVIFYESAYYSKAEEIFKKYAANNMADPMYNLGILYEHGNGATQDLSEALHWFWEAKDNDCPDAYLKLISFYMHGIGIQKNYDLAFKYCREAALKGDGKAQTILGFMYNNGWGCQSNTQEGLRWTKTAAQKKYPAALYSLGLCYEFGIGVDKDEALSQKYFKEAESLGFNLD